ncbi:MAG: hypothetical protein O2973_06310 [Gemmatimonadetes bacterium]|nr:hypothetical protein [Gemmatimonadota bacterium]
MSSGPPRAVVAGHAGFAAALIELVGCVAGRADVFRAVTNEGCDSRGVEEALRVALREHGASVVFTDLPAGSVAIAARRIAHSDPSVAVVTGASAAMLLDFALGDDASAEALGRAAARARDAIVVHPASGAPRAD